MLHEVAEVGDLHATNSLSGACEDYLLGKLSDYLMLFFSSITTIKLQADANIFPTFL